jgi:hypothetical protein
MKLGVYTAVVNDLPLRQALSTIRSLGLDGAELNASGHRHFEGCECTCGTTRLINEPEDSSSWRHR